MDPAVDPSVVQQVNPSVEHFFPAKSTPEIQLPLPTNNGQMDYASVAATKQFLQPVELPPLKDKEAEEKEDWEKYLDGIGDKC